MLQGYPSENMWSCDIFPSCGQCSLLSCCSFCPLQHARRPYLSSPSQRYRWNGHLISLYFIASLATPPGNSSPKRDNQVISLRDRLHEPPCSAISAERWVTACSVSWCYPPAAQRGCLPHDNEITATSPAQGLQWDLHLPGPRVGL